MNEEEILNILKEDPGNSVFADYAESLHKEGASDISMIVLLKGLSVNPAMHKGRLILAKVYFDLGFKPFCIDQLKILNRNLPKNKSIFNLLSRLDPQEFNASTINLASEVKTIAEADFDFGEIDLIEEDN